MTKPRLTLTLNVVENRDSSFGSSKEIPLSGSTTCCCSCSCSSSAEEHEEEEALEAL